MRRLYGNFVAECLLLHNTHVVLKCEEKTEIINYLYIMTALPVSCGRKYCLCFNAIKLIPAVVRR